MGLFFNYTKPGKGVTREEAAKRSFFGILKRKWTLIVRANLLFFGVNILLFAALALYFLPLFIKTDNTTTDALISHLAAILAGKGLLSPIPFLILALFAPTFAGFTYLCRNFAKQEHVFLASDFFEQTKKNLKQSIPTGFILSAVLYLGITAFLYYLSTGMLLLMMMGSVIGLLLLFASYYVFPVMITFDLSLRDIFKNAFLLAFANMRQNILVFAALTAIHLLIFWIMPYLWVFLMIFFLIAFSTYTVNYIAWDAISAHMMKEGTNI